jgi:hypothetical protein
VIRVINEAQLIEYQTYSYEDQLEVFVNENYAPEELYQDKIPISEFNIYRFYDFRMLWLINGVIYVFAVAFKTIQFSYVHYLERTDSCQHHGLRGKANAYVTWNLKKTFCKRTSFFMSYMEAVYIIRRAKIGGILRQVRSRLGVPERFRKMGLEAQTQYVANRIRRTQDLNTEPKYLTFHLDSLPDGPSKLQKGSMADGFLSQKKLSVYSKQKKPKKVYQNLSVFVPPTEFLS